MKICHTLTCFFFLFNFLAEGQETFANTLFYHDSIGTVNGKLSDLKWIEGLWEGEAFGGKTQEFWSPPTGGSMMCAFKLVLKGDVKFYEFVTITEEEGTLIMRLKHFHSDLKGWEEKDKSVDFKLVKLTKNKVYFDGFTFEKISNNEINIYVVIENNNEQKETKFNYKKVKN